VSRGEHDEIRRQFLRRLLAVSGGVAGASAFGPVWAASNAQVLGLRFSAGEGFTRVVFDLSAPVQHNLFVLRDPHRVVVDLEQAFVRDDLDLFTLPRSVVRGVRHAMRDLSGLRIVLDLSEGVQPRSFLLAPDPEAGAGHRLVVDLRQSGEGVVAPVITADQYGASLRDVVIAIDAGHGGKDPGAVGKRGTREKDVVLSVARKLAQRVERESGMKAVLVRDGDYFMPLRDRIGKARAHKADLFVSIHADANPDKRVHGSSVYVLSRNGASSEFARWLAERENAADLVGGVSLSDKDELLASVLLDLSQTATMEASVELAEEVLDELNRVADVRRLRVEKAGFAVLKSPDIPSILVETAFITNPAEEKRLRTNAHQDRLADAMLGGLRDYFRNNAPPGTHLAQTRQRTPQRYVIRRGDTLSEIATQHGVSLDRLRKVNNLRSDRLRIGQTLVIPLRES
jgi:N-acetylmuramoyl-L-alanine amidase